MEYVYCRINDTGYFLGRKCPCDNIRITREVYSILRASGLNVEIYDPVEEAKKQAILLEEAKAKNEVLEDKPVALEASFQVDAEMSVEPEPITEAATEKVESVEEVTEKSEFIKQLEDEIAESKDDLDNELDSLVEDYDPEVKEISEAKKYTHEELEEMTRAELQNILITRGHTGGRDPLSVKQKDRRSDIIRKIIEIQSNKED